MNFETILVGLVSSSITVRLRSRFFCLAFFGSLMRIAGNIIQQLVLVAFFGFLYSVLLFHYELKSIGLLYCCWCPSV